MLSFLILCGAVSLCVTIWLAIRLDIAIGTENERSRAVPAVVGLIVSVAFAAAAFTESMPWIP